MTGGDRTPWERAYSSFRRSEWEEPNAGSSLNRRWLGYFIGPLSSPLSPVGPVWIPTPVPACCFSSRCLLRTRSHGQDSSLTSPAYSRYADGSPRSKCFLNLEAIIQSLRFHLRPSSASHPILCQYPVALATGEAGRKSIYFHNSICNCYGLNLKHSA